jgi:hypothetical protein
MGPFRVDPALPAGAYKTYGVAAPAATHFRAASCAEARCPAHLAGWLTAVDETTDLGQGQAHYIRREAGRRYAEFKGQNWRHLYDDAGRAVGYEMYDQPGVTTFRFEAGQRCFGRHRVPLDKPEIYTVRGGDWRGDPAGGQARLHASYADWLDDFGEHQQRIADAIERG